jgi:G:T/U-mismatch repair DNA glycosylase
MCIIEVHPYKTYLNNDSTKLIIGSFPPHRFTKKEDNCTGQITEQDLSKLSAGDIPFYYGSVDNSMWEILRLVYRLNDSMLDTVCDIKKFLSSHKIAITDIIAKCCREGTSSSDSDLFNKEYRAVKTLLLENKNIEKIYFTSKFVSDICRFILKGDPNFVCTATLDQRYLMNIGQRRIECHILFSPSPNGLRAVGKYTGYKRQNLNPNALTAEQYRLEQYRNFFNPNNICYGNGDLS